MKSSAPSSSALKTLRSLARDPDDRFATAGELREELLHVDDAAVDGDAADVQRVAQRNEVAGFLRSLNACNPRDAQHVALFGGATLNQRQGVGLHVNAPTRHANAFGMRFVSHIDHVSLALGVEMGEWRRGRGRV